MPRRADLPRPQLLLLAEPLEREGLTRWLEADPAGYRVVADAAALEGGAALVLWCPGEAPPLARLRDEVLLLQDRWQPAPLLLLLRRGHGYGRGQLLSLPAQGLLDQAEPRVLCQAVATLLAGGREVALTMDDPVAVAGDGPAGELVAPAGVSQSLLRSGLAQIDAELVAADRRLHSSASSLALLLEQGRQRELRMARTLLLWLWGPLSPLPAPVLGPAPRVGGGRPLARPMQLSLRQRNAEGIWEALHGRLRVAVSPGPTNHTGQLLALDGLHPERRRDLFQALLEQFAELRGRFQGDDLPMDEILRRWRELQPQLRQQALRQMAGAYVQLPWEGGLRPVVPTLLQQSDLAVEDPELPDPMAMLAPLVLARPLLVEGRLLAPDEPEAVLHLELLLSNWLVRSAERISAEVLAAGAAWPELRRYLLSPELLATRNLERLRNQLNAQQRWSSWVERPRWLYESRRPLFRLEGGRIDSIDLTEPRDTELRQLGWPQQLVTLMLETRDALAPQLQALLKALGDLFVVVLTRVLGRAIGLVGRGIAQGMGRSLGRG